jgi:hypothetical protein
MMNKRESKFKRLADNESGMYGGEMGKDNDEEEKNKCGMSPRQRHA